MVDESLAFVQVGGSARLRCVAAPSSGRPRGTVFLAPPFAEELNKSRRMCALTARALAQDGWRVVRLDLFGCGDSAGEFSEASWSQWIEDLLVEAARARDECPGPLWIWCIRAGALFAPELLKAVPDAGLILWQPVLSGRIHLQQFLRIEGASRLVGGAKSAASAATPAQRLAAGEVVEVAGYELPPAVADGLQAAAMTAAMPGPGRMIWLDLSPVADATPAPAAQQLLAQLRAAGWTVQHDIVLGAPFWHSTEIVENDALIVRTRELLALPAFDPVPESRLGA